MARILASIPDVEAPSSDYPNARILNEDTSVSPVIPGTPVVEELYGDMVQFFQKLLIDAGITANDLPDNVTNGYQLLTALMAKIDTIKGTTEGKVPIIGENYNNGYIVVANDDGTLRANIATGLIASLSEDYQTIPTIQSTLIPGQIVKVGSTGLVSQDLGDTLITKVIDIGDWNMDSISTAHISHGISDYTKIRNICVLIRNDANDKYLNILSSIGSVEGSYKPNGYINGVGVLSTSQVSLARELGGYFDSTDFDSTSYNRGWVTIQYSI